MITLQAVRFLSRSCVAILVFMAVLQPVQAESPAPKKARAVYAPRPQVPEVARARRLGGDGYFKFHIRPDGTVSTVDVLRSTGHKVLDDATVAALSKWRFEPGTRSEVRVPFTYTGNYNSR